MEAARVLKLSYPQLVDGNFQWEQFLNEAKCSKAYYRGLKIPADRYRNLYRGEALGFEQSYEAIFQLSLYEYSRTMNDVKKFNNKNHPERCIQSYIGKSKIGRCYSGERFAYDSHVLNCAVLALV